MQQGQLQSLSHNKTRQQMKHNCLWARMGRAWMSLAQKGAEAGGMLPDKGKGPTKSRDGRSDHKSLKYKYTTMNLLQVVEAGSLKEAAIEQRSKAVAQLP